MRLCCNCFEELLDREVICPICNCNETLDNNQTKDFYFLVNEVRKANKLKKQLMKKDLKYKLVFKYIEYRDKHPKEYNNSKPAILNNNINKNESNEEFWQRINQHTINKIVSKDPIIVCPYCKSNNVKKISTTSRVISTSLFGLGSAKVGKQYHCNKCKSDF